VRYLIALASAVVFSVGLSPAYAETDPRIDAAESAVKEGLNDPGSAIQECIRQSELTR
jgi:hypothetical protein